jgi:hypothetical protein
LCSLPAAKLHSVAGSSIPSFAGLGVQQELVGEEVVGVGQSVGVVVVVRVPMNCDAVNVLVCLRIFQYLIEEKEICSVVKYIVVLQK